MIGFCLFVYMLFWDHIICDFDMILRIRIFRFLDSVMDVGHFFVQIRNCEMLFVT